MTKCCVVGCNSEEARKYKLMLTGKPVNVMVAELCSKHAIEAGLMEWGS